jgi:hypothetical protein
MDQIGGEPTVGKRRAVGPAENNRTGLAQIVDHGTVAARDRITLQLEAVGGSESGLIDIDLDRDGYPRQHTGIFTPRDRRIDRRGLRQHIFRPMIDHRID